MKPEVAEILVVALGNDLMGDDAVAWVAARALRMEFDARIDVVETGEAGLALMETMQGYQRVLILDTVATGNAEPGTVVEFPPDAFRRVLAPSPHYAGLPEILSLARRLQIDFPSQIQILAMHINRNTAVSEELSPTARRALPELIRRARVILALWIGDESAEASHLSPTPLLPPDQEICR